MEPVWDGITRQETLTPEGAALRQRLADAAKAHDWPLTLGLLGEHGELVNATRPGGPSLYAPLHHAAYGGCPAEVVKRLLDLGAWRTLQNARGERPVDVAERRGSRHLLSALEPELKRQVPNGILLKVQQHFHAVIRGRAGRLVEEYALRLPELEPLLEMDEPAAGSRSRACTAGSATGWRGPAWTRCSLLRAGAGSWAGRGSGTKLLPRAADWSRKGSCEGFKLHRNRPPVCSTMSPMRTWATRETCESGRAGAAQAFRRTASGEGGRPPPSSPARGSAAPSS